MPLHPDISFCRIQGEFVFLDLAQDRYFSLGHELAGDFAAVISGAADPQTCAVFEKLGIVVPGHGHSGGQPLLACASDTPRASLLDLSRGSTSAGRLLRLTLAFAVMRAKLSRHGIAGPAGELAAARGSAAPPRDNAELGATATAYDWFSLLRGAHNLCLPHSLVLATDLARKGFAAHVVLGVQLRPFAAHCWVECQGHLVNDRFDRVRSYTPIRRL
ncbi:lasso peptide biosynthesis B2 protein [Novosphingobium sp. G106]|uniref:lasso peptide biosynthesis B2 protein n=1 Tax=Novosphingobium sp. G106 TaxID=2849500 RepID=UPI001C2DC89B|nr:lasso peptide biosynthesis B2 protein [Novosphingobium sp. G106]MBV1691393.1 lasso peptide biosynthesis B2 protein [Novosphingobium sp. G106]